MSHGTNQEGGDQEKEFASWRGPEDSETARERSVGDGCARGGPPLLMRCLHTWALQLCRFFLAMLVASDVCGGRIELAGSCHEGVRLQEQKEKQDSLETDAGGRTFMVLECLLGASPGALWSRGPLHRPGRPHRVFGRATGGRIHSTTQWQERKREEHLDRHRGVFEVFCGLAGQPPDAFSAADRSWLCFLGSSSPPVFISSPDHVGSRFLACF